MQNTNPMSNLFDQDNDNTDTMSDEFDSDSKENESVSLNIISRKIPFFFG
jgi:hypothetical protein